MNTSTIQETRFVGFVALAYATSMITQNTIFAITAAPDYSAPLARVLTYHAENQSALAITSGLEALNMVLLLLFITSLHGLVQRQGSAGANWSRFAVASGATLSSLFAFTIATHIAVTVAAKSLTESNSAFELMWQFHAAAFALSLPALGATLIGLALATHASELTRPWQRLLGITGGSLCIVAGLGNLTIADGSPFIFVGVLGGAMWLIWVISTSLRLIRG
ncbi:MAG: hypothetical protein V4606_03265 [Patescibacteria group bacterium]